MMNHFTEKHEHTVTQKAIELMPCIALFCLTIPLAYLMNYLSNIHDYHPERSVFVISQIFLVIMVLPIVCYMLYKRRTAIPADLGLIVIATVATLLVSVYLYWVSFYIYFPADILLWSESDFVNDILKLRIGYPLYSMQQNNESFVYTPGSQMLTYLIASLLGKGTSIPAWRVIQLGYILLSSIIAVLCCCTVIEMSMPKQLFQRRRLWYMVWLPIFFLISSNSITNDYVHFLHNDALALLISVVAYWLLLKYVSTHDKSLLIAMFVIPAVGFFVKQSLAIWAPIYCAYLILFDRPRSISRIFIFAAASSIAITGVVACSYLIWGDHFIYWIFKAMGHDPISPIRSFQHIMDAWAYFAAGMLGGLMIIRGKSFNLLVGVWLVWLFLITLEGSTSGIGWMKNHMGPGSLIAGIWFLAGLVRLWQSLLTEEVAGSQLQIWLRAGILVTSICLLFGGLGFIRVPVKHLSDDAYRYIKEIENEFEGHATSDILLDAGTWIYLKEGVLMKDRSIPFGNRGYNGTGDFSGMIRRLKEKRYAKILVRDLESPIFQYDHWLWPQSSGIKKTLLENYYVDRKIRKVEEKKHQQVPYFFFDEISILLPK
jgi:hypothetical protein